MFSLAGRRALVTGSSRGIGFCIAAALAGAGADVIINGRDEVALGEAAARLAEGGATVRAVAFDVTSEESVGDAIDWCEDEVGPVDILVNNAGMQYRTALEDFPADKFDQVIRTNLHSAFYVGQAVAKRMIPRGHGKIINICSVMSNLARPSIAPYAASKAAIANLTRGEYFYAGTATDLKKVYQSLSSRLMVEKKETEVSSLFAALGAVLVLIAATLSVWWFGRVM
jgi:gluconate 5-dehydrogenase